jgi:CRP/FNR family transcriptional regulator
MQANSIITDTVRAQLFKNYPVLQDLTVAQLEKLFTNSPLVRAPVGTIVFVERQKTPGFPFIISGNARVFKSSVNGRELHLYNVGPGDSCIVASSSLLGDTECNASAIVDRELELLQVKPSLFKSLLAENESFRDYVLENFSKNLNHLTQMVSAVVFQKLDQRLAAALLIKENPIEITHQVLADELGSVREIISRLLKNFSEKGWLVLERGQIQVLNTEALKEYSNFETTW